MKIKSKKPFLNMDERNKQIAGKVIAVMYIKMNKKLVFLGIIYTAVGFFSSWSWA